MGVFLWHSGLGIQHGHCRGLGGRCGISSIPGPGSSICCRQGQNQRNKQNRVPWWNIRLRIQCWHYCGSDCCSGMGSIPSSRTYACHGCHQKIKTNGFATHGGSWAIHISDSFFFNGKISLILHHIISTFLGSYIFIQNFCFHDYFPVKIRKAA